MSQIDIQQRNNVNKEDDWLQGVLDHLRKISADPEAYVDYWDLEEVGGVTPTVIGSIWKADFLTIS